MRIAVYGLGAIGGYIAARLARAGADVCGVARNATLEAVRSRGIGLHEQRGEPASWFPLEVAERLVDLAPVDCVILAVKSPAVAAVAADVASGLQPTGRVVSAMNGVPWWFVDQMPGPLQGLALDAVDPGNRVLEVLPASRVIGAAIHLSAFTAAPGEIVRTGGNRIVVGEAGHHPTFTSAGAVGSVLGDAGFEVEVSADIRRDIWFKLCGNVALNPVSMLTRMPSDRLLADPFVRAFLATCVSEANDVGNAIGVGFSESADERLDGTARLGSFRPSMLQDAEAGRPVEIDAVLAAVREIGEAAGVPTPGLDALLGLCRLHIEAAGLGAGGRPVPLGPQR